MVTARFCTWHGACFNETVALEDGMPRIVALALLCALAACGSRSVNTDARVKTDARKTPDGRTDGALPSCGDPKLMAAFAGCVGAQTRSACEQAGGNWTPIGLYPESLCVCSTGQGGCSCKRSADCLGPCRAPMPSMWDCSNAKGTCAGHSPSVGCWCWFDDEGNAQGICAD